MEEQQGMPMSSKPAGIQGSTRTFDFTSIVTLHFPLLPALISAS